VAYRVRAIAVALCRKSRQVTLAAFFMSEGIYLRRHHTRHEGAKDTEGIPIIFESQLRGLRAPCFFYFSEYTMSMDDKALFERLDRIIYFLEHIAQQPTLRVRIINGAATGAGILGILSAIDIIKTWLGG